MTINPDNIKTNPLSEMFEAVPSVKGENVGATLRKDTMERPTQGWLPNERKTIEAPASSTTNAPSLKSLINPKIGAQRKNTNKVVTEQDVTEQDIDRSTMAKFNSIKVTLRKAMSHLNFAKDHDPIQRPSVNAQEYKNIKLATSTMYTHLTKESPKNLKHDLAMKIIKEIKVANEKLEPQQMTKVKLSDHKIKFYVQKDARGKLTVLPQVKKLGKGGYGKVMGVSSHEGEKLAVKHTLQNQEASMSEESEQDIELETVNYLNADDLLHEGVQPKLSVAYFVHTYLPKGLRKLGETLVPESMQKIIVGKWYSNGDMHDQSNAISLQQLLGRGDSSRLLRQISPKLQNLNRFLSEKLEEKENIKNSDFPSEIKEAKLNQLYQEIDKEFSRLIYCTSNSKILYSELESFISKLKSDKSEVNPQAEFKKISSKILAGLREAVEKMPEPLTIEKRMGFSANLVNGLMYIFSKGVIHGDIKPGNFFWNDSEAVIGDFGSAQRKDKEHSYPPPTTALYLPPTYLDARNHYTSRATALREEASKARGAGDKTKAKLLEDEANLQEENWFRAGKAGDTRSMGVSLYQMLTGGEPVSHHDIQAYYGEEAYKKMKEDLIDAGVNPRAAEIISKMAQPHALPRDPSNPRWYKVASFPDQFPLPVSDEEMKELATLLKQGSIENKIR